MKTSAVIICGALGFGASAAAQDHPLSELWLHEDLLEVIAQTSQPAPFTTDGCSGGMSQVWSMVATLSPGFVEMHGQTPPWEACCVTHDRAYHSAGDADGETSARQSWHARLEADKALRVCVTDAAPSEVARLQENYGLGEAQVLELYRWLGEAMFHAVRLGGAPCSGLPWRWGYGYPSCVMGMMR
ncbi:MAG: hypothetical protein OIF40_13735 [Mangrovicoccus sp.]|nr:hypothetical protein [Mangrovicoccus sp.]